MQRPSNRPTTAITACPPASSPGNVGRGMQLGQQLNVGLLHVNDQTVNDEVVNPFGGFGASGNATASAGLPMPMNSPNGNG